MAGQIQVQAHWAGMLAQRLAENVMSQPNLTLNQAWLVAAGVPIIQYQGGV